MSGEIKAELGLDTTNFDKGMVSASSKMADFSSSTKESIGEVSSGFNKAQDETDKLSTKTEASSQKQGQSWSRVGKAVGAVALISAGLFKSMVDASPSMSVAFAEMKFEFEEMFMVIGEELAPIIQDTLVPAVKSLTGFIISLDSETLTLIGSGVGLVTGFTTISSIVGIMGGSITALLGPIGLVILAIAGLALAWNNDWGGIQEKAQFVWDFLKDAFSGITFDMEGLEESFTTIFENIGDAFDVLFDVFRDNSEGIGEMIGNVGQTFSDVFSTITKLFTSFVADMTGMFKDWVGDNSERIQEFIDKFNELWVVISPIIDKIVEIVVENLLGKLKVTWKFIMDLVASVMDIFIGLFDFLIGLFTGDWDRAVAGLEGIFKGIVNVIIDALNWVIGMINEGLLLVENVINAFKSESKAISIANIPLIPRLHGGGTVPGPIGQERLIVALGGEEVYNPMRGESAPSVSNSKNITIYNKTILQNPQFTDRQSERRILREFDKNLRKNQTKFFSAR